MRAADRIPVKKQVSSDLRNLLRLPDRLGPMDVTDQESAIVSDLADLDRVRLADLQVTDEATSSMLSRIVPATPGQGVSVAAFNSAV